MPSPPDPLAHTIAALGDWLRQAAWPLWLARGIDARAGAFHEWIEVGPCTADHRRLRVAARQVVTFSDAAREGVAGAEAAVRLGLDFLLTGAACESGGYHSRFGLDNRVEPGPQDTYDHAFVLLAFARAAGIVPAADLQPHALALVDWLDGVLAHPAGGYAEGRPAGAPRRQNPHMHLLEAFAAAAAAFGDPVFGARAEAMAALFRERLYQPREGALPEYFTEDWRPLREDGAFLVEPGHHAEWTWLLAPAGEQGLQAALMRFVDQHGQAPAGGLANLVASDGTPRDGGTRLWPQAEWLRAELVRPAPDPARQLAAARELQRRLTPEGAWFERVDAAGRPMAGPAPASSLYHVSEAILAAGRWQAAPARPTSPP